MSDDQIDQIDQIAHVFVDLLTVDPDQHSDAYVAQLNLVQARLAELNAITAVVDTKSDASRSTSTATR
ncbi:MAG: hypothetical protein QM747_17950 [Nocardioides sp.]